MTLSLLLRLLLALVLLPGVVTAQGVTTAAVHGTITTAGGSPLPAALVSITSESTGRRWEILTSATGRFVLEAVAVGGPYRIDVRSLGFAPAVRTGIMLQLGQRLIVEITLHPVPVELARVNITAAADALPGAGRIGPTEIVSSDQIAMLPNPGRDFVTLMLLSPQAIISPSSGSANTGGISIGAQNRLYNGFQIDGGVNHDLYRGRLPGRESFPRPISLEVLEEIQILAAPFDVRYGGTAGGLVNAVTKSGSNSVHGSVFGFLSDATLVGRGAAGAKVGDFTTWQYGGTIAGPIAQDRTHYFLSIDAQHGVVPDPGPLVTDTSGGADTTRVGISYRSAARFQDILREVYRLEPGTPGPVDGEVWALDAFGKISIQLRTNSHAEASHHYTHGSRSGFIDRVRGTYFLSSFSQRNPSTSNASRFIWSALVGERWSSELIASRLDLHDSCRPDAGYPLIRAGPIARGQLVAGAGGSCPAQPRNSSRQEVLELTWNLTGAIGSHIVTLGAHGAAAQFSDEWIQNSSGIWNFVDLDSLESGRASRYERTLPGPEGSGALRFRTRQLGFYVQDRWLPNARLAVTFGLRMDTPFLPDRLATNDSLEVALDTDTGRLPDGTMWSPRLGIHYQPGDQRTSIRGGIGLFSGPPPYTWLGNAYRDNGRRELFLACAGRRVPPFDPARQPSACADGTGPFARFSFFDAGAKFPQNLRLTVSVDRALPRRLIGTLEILYTRALEQFYVTDANLVGPVGAARGEGNRPLYGAIGGTRTSITAVPSRSATAFGQVVRVSNRSGDEALSLSAQLRTPRGSRLEGSALYAYSRARDRMSLVNPLARQNLENTPLEGRLESRPLRTSYFEVPHRVLLSTTVLLPFASSLSLFYAGASGTPYTYVIEGDVNADGIPPLFANDIAYVPRDSLDISLADPDSWQVLDAFIQAEPCLRRQRGRIMARNSCRNPWFGTVSARVAKRFPTAFSQSLELTANVYNLPNLLNRRWGQSRLTVRDPWVRLLSLVGYDSTAERGVYRQALPALRRTLDRASRWQVELGARYAF